MLLELLPAVAQDTVVTFQHQSAICKRAKGKPLLVMSNLIKKPISLVIAVKGMLTIWFVVV